ncbi:cobalamin biosynthesis protein [uncultured Pelagimonas sp.]|uniref:cobalamin biosynthesis protein n=1 Tax=uncultured Pelagimonas sp. TaxID=1618102 RepID=UPI00262E0030|nr:cobalamin biosynthesis protein [uncultured Pelagimonas sp.]
MKVVGVGYRSGADMSALKDAVDSAGTGAEAIAVSDHKTDLAAVTDLATTLKIPLITVSQVDLEKQTTLTQSTRQQERFGVGSLAEAVALAAAGPNARLLGPRVISSCGMATAAFAEGHTP